MVGIHYLGVGQRALLRPRVAYTFCHTWRVERTDGVVLRFASHDKKIKFDGETYEAIGASATDLEQTEGLGESDFEVLGFLNADSLRPADLWSRRYDNASILHRIIDWQRPWPWYWLRKHRWWIKTVGFSGGMFRAQVHGIERWLSLPGGSRYEFDCDLTLGEARCGATPHVVLAAVVDTVASTGTPILGEKGDRRGFTITAGSWVTPPRDGLMILGEAVSTNGPNKGRKVQISAHVGRQIVVENDFTFRIKAGDTFVLRSGCDHTLRTCTDDYAVRPRYGGFPFMPSAQDLQQKAIET